MKVLNQRTQAAIVELISACCGRRGRRTGVVSNLHPIRNAEEKLAAESGSESEGEEAEAE